MWADFGDLCGGEELVRLREFDALRRHAVDAAEAAALGEGDAQIRVATMKQVGERIQRWAADKWK